MLGRKNYTTTELENGRAAMKSQLETYKKLVATASSVDAKAALAAFEPLFFNQLSLALDRLYVHRIRAVTGKENNPLNELELICEALIDHHGVFRGNNVIKYTPTKSVLQLEIGDKIGLTQQQFERLSSAFFTDLEAKFAE
jgi:hypothetical protein